MTAEWTPPGRPDDLRPGDTYCRDCGVKWRGASRICHCRKCHRSFTGLAGFDAHQTTVCDRCTVDKPCDHGSHQGAWHVVCRTGVLARAEIAADASGRLMGADAGRVAVLARARAKAQEAPAE